MRLALVLIAALVAGSKALRPSEPGGMVGRQLGRQLGRHLGKLALSPLQQDLAASTLSVGGTIVWLQIWIGLAKQGKIEPALSRKIIHTGSAPLFMCLWPLFSSTPNAKYFAAGVVALQMSRLIVAGVLKSKETAAGSAPAGTESSSSSSSGGLVASSSRELVNAISRSGSSKEVLGGPLVYTVALLFSTLLWFRENPAAVVAVSQMAAGDGMADIVGRRWGGSLKWPIAGGKKSVAGSVAFVLSAFVVTSGLLGLYHATGFLPSVDIAERWPTVLLISLICAAVELLPLGEDNVTVPLSGAALSLALL